MNKLKFIVLLLFLLGCDADPEKASQGFILVIKMITIITLLFAIPNSIFGFCDIVKKVENVDYMSFILSTFLLIMSLLFILSGGMLI